MQIIHAVHGQFLLALALSLPMAAQAPADSTNLRLPANAIFENSSPTEQQKFYEQTLEQRRREFGENSAAYAGALVDLARVYQATGKRSAEAMQLYRQA